MATKRTGDACYEKADPDEPIFVLRAQDVLAPWLVRLWVGVVTEHIRAKKHLMTGDERFATVRKLDEACDVATRMEQWQERTGRHKWPD